MVSVETEEKMQTQESSEHSEKPDECINDYIAETRPWYHVPHLRNLAFYVFLITLTSTTCGYDGSLLNGLQSLTTWERDMGEPEGQRLGALTNGVNFGGLVAIPFASYLADKFGRKPMILVGEAICVIGAILQGVSTSYGFFLGSRIVIGFGNLLAVVPSPILISEIAYPTHRETSTFAYNICWYLGALIASWVTYGTRNIDGKAAWAIPSYIQGFFPLVQVLTMWFVPESPRYYVSMGKKEKARAVLAKHHTGNSEDPTHMALVEFELKEIEAALEQEKLSKDLRYVDFILKRNLRKRGFLCVFMAVIMQFCGNSLVSYYLSKVLDSIGITSTSKQLEINGCLMLYNFVVCFAVASVNRLFKRRTLFLSCFCGMLVTYIIWTVLSAINQERDFKDKGLANGVLAMIFLYYLCYDIGVNGLPFLYLTEVLPYMYRGKGINILEFATIAIGLFNNYVNSIAMDAIEWKYYIVYCCLIAVELVVIFFTFPETSGYTLEEVAQVFGDEPPELENKGFGVDVKQSIEYVEHV